MNRFSYSHGKLRILFAALFVLFPSVFLAIYSRNEVIDFYLDNATEVITPETVISMGDPICTFKGLSVSEFEAIYLCTLNDPCPDSAHQVVRFSPFRGTYTFPDTVAETLAFSCPEVIRPDVLDEVRFNIQKGG